MIKLLKDLVGKDKHINRWEIVAKRWKLDSQIEILELGNLVEMRK